MLDWYFAAAKYLYVEKRPAESETALKKMEFFHFLRSQKCHF